MTHRAGLWEAGDIRAGLWKAGDSRAGLWEGGDIRAGLWEGGVLGEKEVGTNSKQHSHC